MEKIMTERCQLSKIKSSDTKDIIKVYTNEKTRKYLGGPLTKKEAEEKVKKLVSTPQDIYTVRLRKDNMFIGLIYILPYYDTDLYEISYEFLPQFWNKGYAYEVMKKCLAICNDELGYYEIVAETQKKNINSKKLLEKLGYSKQKEIVRFSEEQIVYAINLVKESR